MACYFITLGIGIGIRIGIGITSPSLHLSITCLLLRHHLFPPIFQFFRSKDQQKKTDTSFPEETTMHNLFRSRLLFFFLLLVTPHNDLMTIHAFTGFFGVNYGRLADNIPSPEGVVTLLKAAKIKNVRIFDANQNVLQAFNGSGLNLNVMVPNELLIDMSVNEDKAMQWIKDNVQPYLPGTHITGISLGNEILGVTDLGVQQALLGAITNIYNSLSRLQLADQIEVSTPNSEAVFTNSYPPSSCVFKDDIFILLKPILEFFSQTNVPFYINAYPFLAYKSDPAHIDINYALFKKSPGIYDPKSALHYDNMLDAQIDATYAALDAAGFGTMEVIVSETGWASSGDQDEAGANVQNARTYNYNLLKRLLKKKGTPMRPKIPVRAYVFALFNEDLKPGPTSERHFGLFKADGSIAYDIGFRGLRSSAASLSSRTFKDIQAAHHWSAPYTMVIMACSSVLLLALI